MDADAAPQFPNPDSSERMVLYPLSGGGVALEWKLPPGLIEHALSAFPLLDPRPMLYLRRADGAGVRVAAAELSDKPAGGRTGRACFEMPVVGALQAEVGLEGRRDGGWLLLGRSNRLEAVPTDNGLPKAEDAVARRSGTLPPLVQTDAGRQAAETYSVSQQHPPGLPSGAAQAPATAATLLSPPAVERTAGPWVGPRPDSTDVGAAITSEHTATSFALAVDQLRQGGAPTTRIVPAAVVWSFAASRYPDPSLASVLHSPLRFGRMFPLVAEWSGDVRSSPLSARSDVPPAESSGLEQGASDRRPGAPPAGEADHPTNDNELDERAATRQDNAGPDSSAGQGSGPLAPYPSTDPASIRGELRVFGHAAPGATLDLGGHEFRVGPGGRFSFTVALDDSVLLQSLLARLPSLPVAERDV